MSNHDALVANRLDQGRLPRDDFVELLGSLIRSTVPADPTGAVRNALRLVSDRTRAARGRVDIEGGRSVQWSDGSEAAPSTDRLAGPLHSEGSDQVGQLVLERRRGRFSSRDRALFDATLPLLSPFAACLGVRGCDRSGRLAQLRTRLGASEVIGESPALVGTLESVLACADVNIRVLFCGAPGTGKSMLARVVHRNSGRRGPLVMVNCAQLTRERAMVDLFGACAGAYTGLVGDTDGLLQEAEGGTLFLDEVGELPAEVQAQLLMFLQEGVWRRVGERTVRSADVRVLAATNVDLHKAASRGAFREDLLHRLAEFSIRVPSLDERSSDIALLSRSLLRRAAERLGVEHLPLGADAVAYLQTRDWPGNIRELSNVIRQGLLWARAEGASGVFVRHVSRGDSVPVLELPIRAAARRFKVQYALQVLEQCGGSKQEAALRLGMHRSRLYALLRGEDVP